VTIAPVPPVDAATVILVRDSPSANGGWELFMVRRHVHSEFAADVYVFPGGKIDDADRDSALEPFLDAQVSSDLMDASAYRVGAIRELFEEAGVLLASSSTDTSAGGDRIDSFRQRLRRGEIDLREIARATNLKLALSELHPYAHWITPETMPRRYDTWFYLARLPDGQTPWHDEVETVDSLWIQPAEALRRGRADDFPLVFVTEKQLERMARYGSIDDLLDSIVEADLQPVMPKLVDRDGQIVFLLPDQADY
jgi:8-oxo-dGTP pyrophosphatase MutT (NUDIX family)